MAGSKKGKKLIKALVVDEHTGETREEMIDPDKIRQPQTSKKRGEACAFRMAYNLANTGHPFHHKTADGTIVDSDPTLEHFMRSVGPDDMPPVPAFDASKALPAVPVDPNHYGFGVSEMLAKPDLN